MPHRYHLAQVNIARARAPLDHPLMQDFVDQLAPINALAEASPGFVWRLQDEAGDATGVQAFDDPWIIVNLSLWESLEALRDYVYGGEHLSVLRRRKDWMEKLPGPSLALWWLPAGQLPTLEQARAALQRLAEHGPSAEAFSIARPFPAPSAQALPA
ncbi:DUF3291 domain-containing protein [Pseudomonas citronellolis]|uniref:DUF3291 domain-containing protein n=1 Tax=Pseudomonas citronellolis TaxID=53408 RepID=UPI0018D8B2D8|nr:DUF3291 domain-containing protein [Pseudomonas citronellolis]MBH3431754.1 DUF3291 domain-containing protein [Pseudomonas citronellolis]